MAVWDLENNDFVLFVFRLWNIWTKGRSEVGWQMCCTDRPGGGDLSLRVGPSRARGYCWKQSCRKQDLSQDTWGAAGRGSSSFDEREEKLTDIRALQALLNAPHQCMAPAQLPAPGWLLLLKVVTALQDVSWGELWHTSLWTPWTLYLFLSLSELWPGRLWLTAWNAHSLTELYK